MKHLLICILVVLMGFHSALFALAFDKDKLMELDPLCTDRIAHQSRDFQNKKLWGNLGLGLVLLGVIWNNSGGLGADAKLANLTQGFVLLSTGAIMYYASGDPVVQNDTLKLLDLKGIEAEEVAYSILKYNAARSTVNRINSGLILMATGFGYVMLTSLASSASETYKLTLNISAAYFFLQGLRTYLVPGQDEIDIKKIDIAIGAH